MANIYQEAFFDDMKISEIKSILNTFKYKINAVVEEIDKDQIDFGYISHRPDRPMPGISNLGLVAKKLYDARRFREKIFGRDLFGEPAWDILLDLFFAHEAGYRISITSACIASEVPPTTALRWISEMADKGLLIREIDQSDKRRAFIRLSELALMQMNNYLAKF